MPKLCTSAPWQRGVRRAYVIGASAYQAPLAALATPRNDAQALSSVLAAQHGYVVRSLCDGVVGMEEILTLLARMRNEIGADDRVVFYFAGHGVPPDSETSRSGYLLPETAVRDDTTTFLSMDSLHAQLEKLGCRHLLVILDCCFAGSFRWARTRAQRHLGSIPETRLYQERLRQFLDRRAWQLLTSAGASELATDILFGRRDSGLAHSPFAQALLDGLKGAADARVRDGQIIRDGVITLRKLVDYLSDRMEQVTRRRPRRW
jgi:hypothetical protein